MPPPICLHPPPFWRPHYVERARAKPDSEREEDAGQDLMIPYAPDSQPWAWEIEHASHHPDLVGRALAAVRAALGLHEAA